MIKENRLLHLSCHFMRVTKQILLDFENMHLFIEWSLKDIVSTTSPNKMLSLTFLIHHYEFEQYKDQDSNFESFANWCNLQIDYKESEFKEPCIWFLMAMYDFQNNLDKVNFVLLRSNDLDRVALFYKKSNMKSELISFIQSKSHLLIEDIVNSLW